MLAKGNVSHSIPQATPEDKATELLRPNEFDQARIGYTWSALNIPPHESKQKTGSLAAVRSLKEALQTLTKHEDWMVRGGIVCSAVLDSVSPRAVSRTGLSFMHNSAFWKCSGSPA